MLHDTLRGLGDDWKVDDGLLDGCEMFICAVYGKAKIESEYDQKVSQPKTADKPMTLLSLIVEMDCEMICLDSHQVKYALRNMLLEQIFRPGFGRLQMFQYQKFQSHGMDKAVLRMVNRFGLIQQWYSPSC